MDTMAQQSQDTIGTLSTLPTTRSSPCTDDLLGNRAQAIISVNQRLKQLGIDQTISLPQLCVIGDQSAGKSSLIEAISNIEVPKADGTCTRCPVAINLASATTDDQQWTCKVSIEERYDYLPGRPVSATNPLGPWQKRVDMKNIELATTHDKSRVSELITQAQKQVLDVASAHANINTRSKTNVTTQAKFSPNVIRLDISEGIRANLCFIDLPGVISNVAKLEDRYLIQLVTNLVKEYARNPNNANILALPMSADVENSTACSIIQELQVEERTLAVFTKPDRAEQAEQTRYITQYLIKNASNSDSENDEVTRFQNGCHFVMLANSGPDVEKDFFNQPIWAQLDEQFRQRLGVPALCTFLRDQLFQKTYEALPENLKAIEVELANIERSLKVLPPPPDKVSFIMEMQQILEDFSKSMESKFLGDSDKTIKGSLRTKFDEFQELIAGSSPAVDHATRSEIKAMAAISKSIDELLENNKRIVKTQDPYDSGEAEDTQGRHFRLSHLRSINRTFHHSGLPGEVDPRARTKACKEALECWHGLLANFLNDMHGFFLSHALQVFVQIFKKYQNLGVYSMVDTWLQQYLKEAMSAERHIAEVYCMAERSSPFSMNEQDLEDLNSKKEDALRERRLAFRLELARKEKDIEEGVYKKDRKDVTKDTIERDEYKSEVLLGSKVQAYYEIASKRFVDTICQGVYSRMLPICGEELATALKAHVGTRDSKNEDQIMQWMVEDAQKENLRSRLTHKHQQLLEGRRYIESVLGNTTSTSVSPSKRSSSLASLGAGTEESPTKKPKIAHRPSSVNPITPRSQLTQNLDDFEMIS